MEKESISTAHHRASILQEAQPQYRLVIPADEPVSRQVKLLRRQWEEMFGNKAPSEKPPSITLACFSAREEMEETLMRWIRRICDQQVIFPVVLNNFSAIPPQIVYIRVQDASPFAKLTGLLTSLRDFVQDERIFEKPFIKLGYMPDDAPAEAVMQYTHQMFHAAFTARKLILFKKDGDRWQIVSQFPFRESAA
jgi:hypothetical protein